MTNDDLVVFLSNRTKGMILDDKYPWDGLNHQPDENMSTKMWV